jgi:hypothetical protein
MMAVAAVASLPRQHLRQRHRLAPFGQAPLNLGFQLADRLVEKVGVG